MSLSPPACCSSASACSPARDCSVCAHRSSREVVRLIGRLMSFTCIHCSLRALLVGEAPPAFTETIEEHVERVHPDPLALVEERDALEHALRERLKHDPDDFTGQ